MQQLLKDTASLKKTGSKTVHTVSVYMKFYFKVLSHIVTETRTTVA